MIEIDLLDVVRNAKPTVIRCPSPASAFTQEVVRTMAQLAERPVIFPLNPTSRSESDAADLIDWTRGEAVIGTGGPFPPVLRNGRPQPVDQTNNAYVFPGLGLGAIARAQARRVSNGMLMAAARALAAASPAARCRRQPAAAGR